MRSASLFPLSLVLVAGAAPETYPCQGGLVRSLVAREPMFLNPVAVAVDGDGTIYVTETTRRKRADLDIREVMTWVTEDLSHVSVRQRQDFLRQHVTSENFKNHGSIADHDGNGSIDWRDLAVHSEKIHRLVDTDGDGVADMHTLFAEGFDTEVTGIAAGVLARRGEVFATIAPDVWKLRDTDGDGKADERRPIASGFGIHISYAGHDMHGLTFGPDGKLYWTIGDKGLNVSGEGRRWIYPHEGAVLRCNRDGSSFEVFARGLRNVQQVAFDDHGNLFGIDNDSDQKDEKERLLYIPEGSDHGWRCYYQYRGGKYNPWMAERIAFPAGADRPASVVPPLALSVDGPSGFAYNPGTALNERYRGHFFVTQFPAGKIDAFQLEPDGASFKMTGNHLMAGGTAFTGCNFGPDGALYVADWQGGYPLKEKGALWKIDDPAAAGSDLRREVAAMLREGTAGATDAALAGRLGHADQRVRLEAQWELAGRGKWDDLKRIAASPAAPRIARIHALWGLSQGKRFDAELFRMLEKDGDAELRAQAARWYGEVPAADADRPSLAALIADPSPRVRYHAAMSAGKAADKDRVGDVIAMIAGNAGKDAFLRHAGAFALERLLDGNSLPRVAAHPESSVRLASVVALRNIVATSRQVVADAPDTASEERIAAMSSTWFAFLDDDDPAVVAEAARALHELRAWGYAESNLALLLAKKPDARESALRRSIAANRRSGSGESMLRLAAFAADRARLEALRLAALEALASVKGGDPLDPVDGHHAPLEPVAISPELAGRLAAMLAPLSREPAFARSLPAVLAAIGAKRDAASLKSQALDPAVPADLRAGALHGLRATGAGWTEVALELIGQDEAKLRQEAAALLADEKPDAVLDYLRDTGLKSRDTGERQMAFRLLAKLGSPAAKRLLEPYLSPPGDASCLLEILDAARALAPEQAVGLEAGLAAKDPLGKWSWALAGGDAAAGKKVFEENLAANCTACHRVGKEGSNVGPPLAGIGAKGRRHLLEALVAPQAVVASGYGLMTVTRKDGSSAAGAFVAEENSTLVLSQPDGSALRIRLDDIAARTPPVSSMPPMDAILSPSELRDLVAYLSSLE